MKKIFFVFAVTMLSGILSGASFAEDLICAQGAVQIESTMSTGTYEISDIAKTAKENKIDVVILADRDSMNWEYGLWPLRRIIKKTVMQNSLLRSGAKNYLDAIKKAGEENPGVLMIPGTEAAPSYYWEEDVINKRLKIKDWHKHLIVIGLDNENDYRDLPSIANVRSLVMPFRPGNIILIIAPLFVLAAGIAMLIRRFIAHKTLVVARYGMAEIFAVVLIIAGVLFLISNYPYRDLRYDQYHGDPGIMPYQNLIDYVNERGGATFWAHPERSNIEKIGSVDIDTKEHEEALFESRDYTGFCIFYEGYEKVGRPGGMWDKLLGEYLEGGRARPVWAIGALAFDRGADLSEAMNDLRTVFLVPSINKEEVMKAIKTGRMYTTKGQDSAGFILEKFALKDPATGNEETMGGEISPGGSPDILIKGHFSSGADETIMVKLIKNGNIIKTFEAKAPLDITYNDEHYKNGERCYYRLEIQSRNMLLVTNPVFSK